ncbi:hypothetical protein D3C83_144580 [compost metagenome]
MGLEETAAGRRLRLGQTDDRVDEGAVRVVIEAGDDADVRVEVEELVGAGGQLQEAHRAG